MERQFKCIKELTLPVLDEHGNDVDNEFFIVPNGSVWELNKYADMGDVRLENEFLEWIELDFNTLKECFVEIS